MELPKACDHKTSAFGRKFPKRINAEVLSSCALWPQKQSKLETRIPGGRSSGCAEVRPRQTAFNSNAGFTVIEILVVISLVAIITSLGMAMSMDAYRGFSFRNDRDAVVAALQRARSQAINNICNGASCTDGLPHGIHFVAGAHEIVVFQGNSYNSGEPTNETIRFESSATDVVASADIIFDRLSGEAANITITINDNAGRTANIEINPAGRINY